MESKPQTDQKNNQEINYLNICFHFKERVKRITNMLKDFFSIGGIEAGPEFFASAQYKLETEQSGPIRVNFSMSVPDEYFPQEIGMIKRNNMTIVMKIESNYTAGIVRHYHACKDVKALLSMPGNTVFKKSDRIYFIAQSVGKNLNHTRFNEHDFYGIDTNLLNDEEMTVIKENLYMFRRLVQEKIPQKIGELDEPVLYFVKNPKLAISSLDRINDFSREYVIEGLIVSAAEQELKSDYKKDLIFSIRDNKGNMCDCRIEKNVEYFIQQNLAYNTRVQLEGSIDFDFYMKKFKMKINFIEIIERFNNIKIVDDDLESKQIFYENRQDGLFYFELSKDKQKIIRTRTIFTKPLFLKNIYMGDNKTLYEIEIDGQIFRDEIDKLHEKVIPLESVQAVNKDELFYVMRNFVREARIQNKIIPQKIYNYPGIHLDEKMNFIHVTPGPNFPNLIGENETQERTIAYLQNKMYDETGEGYMNYYNLFMFEGTPMLTRVFIPGFVVIGAFFNGLGNTEIDVFPNMFLVGKASGGKTSWFKLFTECLTGIKMLTGRNIDSESRLIEYQSMCTYIILLDEINKIKDVKIIDLLKTQGTSRTDNTRKTKDQKWRIFGANCNFGTTANSVSWLDDDQALREGRSIIIPYESKSSKKTLPRFKELRKALMEKPLFAKYLFNTAIEYIRNSSQEEISDQAKLIRRLHLKEQEVLKYCDIHDIPDIDNRRYMIYSYILVGLEIWQYLFSVKKGIRCSIIDDFLDLSKPALAEYIRAFEIANTEVQLNSLRSLREFIQEKLNDQCGNDQGLIFFKGKFFITGKFLSTYNEWAIRRNFETYETLKDMAKVIDNVSDHPIKAENRWLGTGENKPNTWSCEFPINEIFPNQPLKPIDVMGNEIDPQTETRLVFNMIKRMVTEAGNDMMPLMLDDIVMNLKGQNPDMNDKTIIENLHELMKDDEITEIKPNIYILTPVSIKIQDTKSVFFKKRREVLLQKIKDLLRTNSDPLGFEDILTLLSPKGFQKDLTKAILDNCVARGELYEPIPNKYDLPKRSIE